MSDDLSPIIGPDGTPFYMGLLQPDGKPDNFVSSAPRLKDSTELFTDSQLMSILNNPNRTPAAKIFSDPVWIDKGYQRSANSCAGWGGGNALSKTRYLIGDVKKPEVLSGSYIYSWCNNNQDKGAPLDKVMLELMEHGTVLADECPWNLIFRSQTAKFDAKAKLITGLALYSVKSEREILTALARRLMVVVVVHVDRGGVYTSYKGTGLVPAFNGVGNHCIHVDDYRFQNGIWQYRQAGNWSKVWGDAGYGWCGFQSFRQPIQYHSYYVVSSANSLTQAV